MRPRVGGYVLSKDRSYSMALGENIAGKQQTISLLVVRPTKCG